MLGSSAALGVLEQAMRAALSSAGARLLEAVLGGQDDGYAGPEAECAAGHRAVYAGSRPKSVATVLGPVRITRAWYHCAACGHGFATRDRQLGIGGGSLSPGLAEMIALAGAEVPFARAAGLLAGLAGIALTPKRVERSAEASGTAARSAAAEEAAAIRERRIRPLPPREPVPDMLCVEVDGTGVRSAPARPRAARAKPKTARPAPGKSSSPGCSPSPGWMSTAGR
jgi:hypothetical protein